MWSVYLLWDVVDAIPVQEKLDEATWNAVRHLLQGVVSQVELHETLQVLERVLPQVIVAQLRGGERQMAYQLQRDTGISHCTFLTSEASCF